MSTTCRLSILLVMLVTSGCASSRIAREERSSLTQVNEALHNRWAVISFADNTRLRNIKDVQVDREIVSFIKARSRKRDTVPTSSVKSVAVQKGGSVGLLAFIGALPGLGIAGKAMLQGSDPGGVSAIGGIIGMGVALSGALVGGMIGNLEAQANPTVVYEGPVERYLEL